MADLAQKIRLRMEATPSHRIDQPIAAVKAVLDVHKPLEWFEECMDHKIDGDDPDAYMETHWAIGEDSMVVCADTRQPDRCAGCTPEGADDDTVMSVKYPCPTLLAVAGALGVQSDS